MPCSAGLGGGNPVFSSFLSFLAKRKKASAKKEKPASFHFLGASLFGKEKKPYSFFLLGFSHLAKKNLFHCAKL